MVIQYFYTVSPIIALALFCVVLNIRTRIQLNVSKKYLLTSVNIFVFIALIIFSLSVLSIYILSSVGAQGAAAYLPFEISSELLFINKILCLLAIFSVAMITPVNIFKNES